jgi:flavin-binding protein dodecin
MPRDLPLDVVGAGGRAWRHPRRTIRKSLKEDTMSVARVTEISSTSTKSFEDAIQQGIARAVKTLRQVKGAWIKEQEVSIEGDRIVAYKVNMKVTFVLDDNA